MRWSAFVIFLLLATSVIAIPNLPTEFYGNITTRGQLASVGGIITAKYLTSDASCSPFTMGTVGAFGLMTCATDDPLTSATEGPPSGVALQFYFNGEPALTLGGDNTTENGTFKYVLLHHPVPQCGDNFCDTLFENNLTCPGDCRANLTANVTTNTSTNMSGNASGNGTGGGGGGATGGGGSSGSASGAAGGGGGGGGGAGGGGGGGATSSSSTAAGILSALSGVAGVTAPFGCTEEWVCTAWENCTIEGLQTRACDDKNGCGTTNDRPPETQECQYEPTCFDRMRNSDETGLDGGGNKCTPCPGCTNGIMDNGEGGVDCGGTCRPCDSCFDGAQDYGETGVDCGGPCPICIEKRPAVLEYPSLICEKAANPLRNDARWFLLLVLVLLLIRVELYRRELKKIKSDQLLDDFRRAENYYEKRCEMLLFILVTIGVCLLSYGYYYEFLLCNIGYQYLWLFLLVLLLIPFIIYSILRLMTYSDSRKLAVIKEKTKTHEDLLAELLVFENTQIVEVEKDIAQRIEVVATNLALIEDFNKLPELKKIYEDVITLYFEYHKNKTPTGIEKDLCDKTYAIETNESFKKLADLHPEIMLIYRKLALLYHHYEQKQKIYDELEQLHKERAQKDAAPVGTMSVEVEDKENDRFDKPQGK